MRTINLAAVPAALVLTFGGLVAVQVANPAPAHANECNRGGDYGEFTPDVPTPTENCDGTKKNTGTPKPPAPVTPKPQPKPQPKPKPKPRPVVQSRPKPRPVVHVQPKPQPQPKPVVRQDAKPPAKISATATKVCVIRVKVTNTGGTTAQVHVGGKVVTVAPKQTVTVEVPVRPDGTWYIKVTGPSFSKVFKGGCDCAKAAKPVLAAVASTEVGQNAVPQVETHFPWLVIFAGMLLTAGGVYPVARRHGRNQALKAAPAEATASAAPAQS